MSADAHLVVFADTAPKKLLRRSVAAAETALWSAVSSSQFWTAKGKLDRASDWQSTAEVWAARHATLSAGYEGRFGDIPRLSMGAISR